LVKSFNRSEILISGTGSIGIRHANNLISLGYKNIIFHTKRKRLIIGGHKFKTYPTLKQLYKNHKPNIALITNETSRHVDTAIECAKKDCDLFIEKPLTNLNKRARQLIRIINKKKNINMVGYMLRFHPIIKIIKKFIEEKKLGDIYHFYSEWGEYLPYWHPKENYKKGYAANKILGGGALLTLSHDIDLMHYFFGTPNSVYINKNKIGLPITADTTANIFVKFNKNLSGLIHVDFLQKKTERYLKIVGTKMVLKFFYLENLLVIIRNNKIKKIQFKKFNRNDLFINEIKYFLKKCKVREKCHPSINEEYSNLLKFKLI
jgi:predicted dehydrogenase